MKKITLIWFVGALIMMIGIGWGRSTQVTMKKFRNGGTEEIIGIISFRDTPRGLKIIPNLSGLSDGVYGFYLLESANCNMENREPGILHLGDFPNLSVDTTGIATQSIWALALTTSDLLDRALVLYFVGAVFDGGHTRPSDEEVIFACGEFID